jgi:protein O-GlcNAcase/histone acetyltransferase
MLSGVIEGFYGRAWTQAQRIEMMDWIAAAGMNTFIYAPKDDVHIRARWRVPYANAALTELRQLVAAARQRGLTFMVAIAPCLDVTYSSDTDRARLRARIEQLQDIGVRDFVLLFDDIPNQLPQADQPHFPDFASAQAALANETLRLIRSNGGGELIFCPTDYCARFTGMDVPGSGYLRVLGEALDPAIKVFWTGPEIVSETIPAPTLREIGAVLKRKPVIWDNYHANDYDIRKVYTGPLDGRGPDILPLISGFITNPNNEFEANFVPVHTTGSFVSGGNYDPAHARETAIAAWQPRFALAETDEDKTLDTTQINLLTELFDGPFTIGPSVQKLLDTAKRMLSVHRPDPADPAWREGLAAWRNFKAEIAALFVGFTELENRELFHAFHPYLWEIQEEVTHLVTYLDWLDEGPGEDQEFPGTGRIHNFYRRGLAVEIQTLLKRDDQGRYHHD